MAYISVDSKTHNSVTLRVRGLDTNYMGNDRKLGWGITGNDGYVDWATGIPLSGGVSSSPPITFSGLTPSTSYNVIADIDFDNSPSITLPSINFTTNPPPLPPRPSNWNWYSWEETIFLNGGDVSLISYQSWNDFIDKIEEFAVYFNAKNGWRPPSIVGHKMTSNNKTLTATRFNGIRECIGAMSSTGISTVAPGDEVKGIYFITLKNSLNNIT